MDLHQAVFPRSVNRETDLIENGHCLAGILYPSQGAEFQAMAEELAQTLSNFSTSRPQMWTDEEVMPGKVTRLPDSFRAMPLIILGDINTNRTLVNLYSRHRCFTDADFPGEDGYELRTIVNAYTRGNNVIVVGGSTPAGVKRGLDRLIELIRQVAKPGSVRLPFVMDIEIAPDLKARLDDYPYTDLNAPKPDLTAVQGYEIMRVIGHYGMMYAITGDRRYGEYSAACLRTFNAIHTDSYGDRHYFMERILYSIYWLEAGGFFSDAEVANMDLLLLGMLFGAQDNWWRRKDGTIPLGHRHQSKGTYEFLQVARFLKENASISTEAEQQCERWIDECEAFMDALCRAGIDDQDDETTLNNMSNLFWYSLNQERFFFFESGMARLAALRALALHDNMGAGAGQGGYGESHMSATYTQQDATTAVAAAAFYYRDGQFKWILENLPHLKEPLRGSIFIHTPLFIHNFSTGIHLDQQPADDMVGIQALAITPHQYVLNTQPPHNWCKLGHYVNAPETWELAEGIGANKLPREAGFDKLTLRSSFDSQGAYLLLQGYQGGFNWQGHQQAANCIVRFSQFGKIFLVQNSRQHTAYDKNGLLISSGWDVEGQSPYARVDGTIESECLGASVTSLPDSRGAEWRRYILWNKANDGYFTVIDAVIPQKNDEYSLTCTWRTLGYAEVHGRTLTAGQGNDLFTLVCGEDLQTDLTEEPLEGAASPYVWRQYRGGALEAGKVYSFQNLFYARPECHNEKIEIEKIAETGGVIRANGALAGWYQVSMNTTGPGFTASADLVWSTPDALLVSGATRLSWPGGTLESDKPFHLSIDRNGCGRLACAGTVTYRHSNGSVCLTNGSVCLTNGSGQVGSGEWTLGQSIAQQLVSIAWQWDNGRTQLPAVAAESSQDRLDNGLAEGWQVKDFGLRPRRLRDVRIFCDPQPLNGFDEQLIDRAPIELREFWQMWPDAPEYKIRLQFPTSPLVDTLRLLGDSFDEPLMRVFNPLPESHIVSKHQGAAANHRVGPFPEVVPFRRYRGQLDRAAGHRVVVGRAVDEIELRFDAPATGNFALQEIELYGGEQEPVAVRHLQAADLDGNGILSSVVVTEGNEVLRIDSQGSVAWRQSVAGPVLHLSFHDLLGDGRKFICMGLLGGELRVLSPDGNLYRSVQLSEQFVKPQSLFGWMETVLGLSIWRRDENGRGALAVGSYGTVIYLDPDFNILGHTYIDGSWIYEILMTPTGGPGGEIWVRCGWNHGLSVFKGLDSFEPSGAFVDFGGMRQPLFRQIECVIPFYTGATIDFEWIDAPFGGRILAGAEYGLGLMDPERRDWVWRFGGLPRVTACLADLSGDRPRVLAAAMDGFVTALDMETGSLLTKRFLGSPVVGLVNCEGLLVAATHKGVYTLNGQFKPVAFQPLQGVKLVKNGPRSVLVLDRKNCLHQLNISNIQK
jgi:hypothetical protein